jgi:chitosanase
VAYEAAFWRGDAASEAIPQASGSYLSIGAFSKAGIVRVHGASVKAAYGNVLSGGKREDLKRNCIVWANQMFGLSLSLDLDDKQDAIADAIAVAVAAWRICGGESAAQTQQSCGRAGSHFVPIRQFAERIAEWRSGTTKSTKAGTQMITPVQKKTILSIVNLFETGTIRGDYSSAICMKGDSGGLTYGRSQTTLNSGNLYKLLVQYGNATGAKYAAALRPYLSRVQSKDQSLNYDMALRQILRDAGTDPVMRSCQDDFFDRVYWNPALNKAMTMGFQTALGVGVVYDSTIHGSFPLIANRTIKQVGTVTAAGEEAWVKMYLKLRKSWLLGCKAPLPNTVYRQDEFRKIVDAGNWALALPIKVRGKVLTLESMGIEADGWKLFLGANANPVAVTWQRAEDEFRNYVPVRAYYNALMGKDATDAKLSYSGGVLSWNGKPLSVPVLMRGEGADAALWGQVRALAGASGLNVERDVETKTLRIVKPTPTEGGQANA